MNKLCESAVNFLEQKMHKVVKGDTLSKIATKYGITVAALKEANGLKSSRISVK